MTVSDAYNLSFYCDDALYVEDCNAWVTPVINLHITAFIVYVEDTDTKKYTWHYFLYKRNSDGTWERKKIKKIDYIVLYNNWRLNFFE